MIFVNATLCFKICALPGNTNHYIGSEANLRLEVERQTLSKSCRINALFFSLSGLNLQLVAHFLEVAEGVS